MQVERITEHSVITPQGEEIVLFLLQPTNVSVLSRESLRARVNALMHVLKGFVEVELLCLNSRESFEHNKRYLTGRMEQEESVPIRTLLEQDLRHLDEIQSRTAPAREFMLIIRPRNIGEREMYPYLSRLEKMIREQGFTVRRAGYEDIKRILAVYFSQDVISEGYDDFDGQRWLLKGNQSDYKAASVMEEAEVLQTFLDLIAPAAIRFEVDRYMVGNTFRCVWAVRGYPTSTEEQALLQRLGERAGVTLHIYTRLVSPAEMLELDRWAVTRLNALMERCESAYQNYEFHVVSHAINDFCVVEMSSFYLDIIKDRLYCEERDGLPRRSAQTALWLILDTMTKLFAPILAFTCDEIWQAMPHRAGDDGRNVLLNEMNKPFTDYALDAGAMARWDETIKVRSAVNAALESARAEKKIGKSLEAKVRLTVPAASAFLADMDADALADVLIVSQAEAAAGEDLSVQVEPAQGVKCERCWKILPSVGRDSAHPTLCARCAAVVSQLTD